MKKAKNIMAAILILSMAFPLQAFSQRIRKWEDVLASRKPVNVYVENIENKSKDPNVSSAEVTQVVKKVFAKRRSPRFNVVEKKSEADIVFKGKISEYTWLEKAPITDIYSPGTLLIDEVTRGRKNWARMELQYKIKTAGAGKILLEKETQITIKQPNVPRDKSYGMICKRALKILALDIFKRFGGPQKRSMM
jgi:hypothetical protein